MFVITIILGVLLIIGGVSCLFTPLATFLSTGYYLGIILLIYGIGGLIKAFQKQADPVEIGTSVLATLVGLFSLFRPGASLIFDRVILTLIACWFVVQGATSIWLAFKLKDVKPGWYWGVISGALGVLLGLYSFAHPMLTAVTAGILIAIYCIQAGINMIVLATAVNQMR